MKANLVKHGGAFFAADDDAKEIMARFKHGSEITVDLKKSRNPQYHRYAFAMLQTMYGMVEESAPFDPWRKNLMIMAGYHNTYGFADGRVLVEAQSLSFESMDDVKFHTVMNDLIQTFIDRYGRVITYDQLMRVAMA